METTYIFFVDGYVFALVYYNTEEGRIYRNKNLADCNRMAG